MSSSPSTLSHSEFDDSTSEIKDQTQPSESTSLSETLKALTKTKRLPPDSTAAKQLTEVVENGSECAVQTLYEGPPKCSCCKNWVEEYPDDLRSSVEQQAETQKKALVVRMGKNHGEGKPLVLDSIVVQSPILKELLGEVFQGYKGITTNLKRLVFRMPFHPFYYRWKAFTEVVEREKEAKGPAAPHAELLYNLLNLELHDPMSEIEDLMKNEVITYETLWALFEPGTQIYTTMLGDGRFFQLHGCEYTEKYFALRSKFVDWDGEKFGYATGTIPICPFEGTRSITDLGAYPITFHKSRELVENQAKERGRKFRDLSGFHYMSYSGMMEFHNGRNITKRNVEGRIVVDASSYRYEGEESSPELSPLDESSLAPAIEVGDDKHSPEYGFRCGTSRYRDRYDQEPNDENVLLLDSVKGETEIPKQELSEEQLLLCNTHVRGYSLKFKRWGHFDVSFIKPIVWNDSAFPNLMLPAGFKSLILSFVEGQAENSRTFDDLIEGKGLGVIMLLVGNPGIGKTLTAEAVADKVRRPLYILSAGELGESADTVEERLQEVLEITEKWNAVLLFDECDVFLERRSVNNLAHNEIVAVFLRTLEYYRGILFLTSNRADAIDPAFQSRIHLTLHYPDLESPARHQIWKQFISRSLTDNELTDQHYDKLAKLPLNGRQIKNIVKISSLLAANEKLKLSKEHIRTVLHVTGEAEMDNFDL